MKGPRDFGRNACCGRDDGSLCKILIAVNMLGFTGGSFRHCAIYFATPEVGSHGLLLWAADELGVASSSVIYRAQVDELLTIRLTDCWNLMQHPAAISVECQDFPAWWQICLLLDN